MGGALMSAWRAGIAAVLGLALVPLESSAQATFTVKPTLTFAVVSDSNLFARPTGRGSDVISRLTPAVEAEYRNRRLTVLGRSAVDAERFDRHISLTTVQARQQAAVDVRYRAARRLTVDAAASFATTQTPGDLNLVSGVTLTRTRARRLAVSPALTYQHDPATRAIVTYAITEDRLAGAVPMLAYALAAAGERRRSPRNTVRLDYVFREFDFGVEPLTRSHTVTAGWTRGLTRGASLSLSGGPRIGDGTIVPELSVSLGYRAPAADLSIEYASAQTTLVGLAGAADTHRLSAAAAYGRRDSFRVRFAPGVMQTARADRHARVYRLSVGASYPMGGTLSLEAAYDVTRQHGDVYAPRVNETITRHLMIVSLTATTPPTWRMR
jgi:hypothetical protein